MFKRRSMGFAATLAVVVLAVLAGCGGGSSGSSSQPTAADVTTTGCRSTSSNHPWGVQSLRTWTPRVATAAEGKTGGAFGEAFEARLVVAYGVDLRNTERQAVFESADGCRRQYTVASLSDADVTVIESAMAAHPSAADPASYAVLFEDGRATQAALDAGSLKLYNTQHFAFWRGVNASGVSNQYVATHGGWDAFLAQAGEFMEAQWLMNRDLMQAPMPYATASDRKKINVYLCGTGLPFVDGGDLTDCWASAADAMWVSATAMVQGHVIMHEYGHVLQFYSGGFRDKADAGPIWETGAQWNSFSLAGWDDLLQDYVDNLESGPLFSHARYGAFPFMLSLHERDATRDLLWSTWLNNTRTATGATTEDFVPAFVRLAQAAGVYPQGWKSFADDMGWYGAQLVAMDFQARQSLSDLLRGRDGVLHYTKRFVPLAATTVAGSYDSPAERPLLEFGTHLVPLTAQPGKVTATLTGGTTANQAAWRFTLVAVGSDGAIRYARLTPVEGTGSAATAIEYAAGESLYLAVTATPYTYETLGWQAAGATTGKTFPYRVQLVNAAALTGSASACDAANASGWDLNYNTNGHVANGAPCR
jgi:hypothetical protein